MKKCIVQYWIPSSEYSEPRYNNLLQANEQKSLVKLSTKSFKKYADKYGHDFKRIDTKKIDFRHPTFERFDLWLDDSWWKEYDEIMYVDCDVFAMPDAPDIFQNYKSLDTFKFAIILRSRWLQNRSRLITYTTDYLKSAN